MTTAYDQASPAGERALISRPIGVLRTPWATREACPRNGRQPDPPPDCRAELLAEFAPGLRDVEGFSHLILIYWLDRTLPVELVFSPPFDGSPRGVFASRVPTRPNPIGLSVVDLVDVDGAGLTVRGLDCIDETPLLDIKPYLPSTDAIPAARMGWLEPHRTR